MTTETITAPYLRRIFEDERVLQGLERAIDITHGKGLETAFRVYKKPCSDLFYPGCSIEIGCPSDAGGESGYEYANNLYFLKTGKDPLDDDNAEDYVEFCMRNTLDNEFMFQDSFMQRGDYPLLNFHIRREGRRIPSNSDLKNLRNVINDHPYARPISCIVSSEQDYPLFLLQAKTNEWENVDLGFIQKMMISSARVDDKATALILQELLHYMRKEANPFKTGFGNYERALKRFTFFPSLKKFEYELEVEE